MITITKGRLLTIRQWCETYGPGSNVVLPAEEAEELARIALASLEAEPVGEFYEYKPGDWYQRSVGDKAPKWTPLYAVPPVLVAPEGLVKAVRFYEQVKRENPPVETGAWKDAVDWVLQEACQARLFIGADRYQTFRNRRIIHEKNQWNVESGEGQDAVACFVIWTCSCNHSDGACRGNKSCA